MRRLSFYWAVLRSATSWIGWLAGIITVLIGGSLLAGVAFVWQGDHRALGVVLLTVGCVFAVLEGAYRVWSPVEAHLQLATGKLDTVEGKRALLDEAISELDGLREEIARPEFESIKTWHHDGHATRLSTDIIHCETKIRNRLRTVFGHETSRRFDSTDTGKVDAPENVSAPEAVAYLERRVARLEEIKGEL